MAKAAAALFLSEASMKKILSLVLALGLMASTAMAAYSDNTNFGSLVVGSVSGSTYAVVTGVAAVKHSLPLQSIMISTYAAPGVSVITTDLYVAGATGLTNTPAATFPSQPASTVGVITFRVPDNYLSGGELHALVRASSTVTATGISVTANAFKNTPGSADDGVLKAGTIVNFPVASSTVTQDLALTNSSITFAPGDLITYKVAIAGTDAVTRQILGLYFSYRPYGVFK